jgi:adenosine kinase
VLFRSRGGQGSEIYADGQRHDIPCVKAKEVVDPTGCGDAYRAGLLYGIARGMDWQITGRLASLLGSVKIASRGGQNHTLVREELHSRFKEHFGMNLED